MRSRVGLLAAGAILVVYGGSCGAEAPAETDTA